MTRSEVASYILDKLLIALIVAVGGTLLAAYLLSRLDVQEQANIHIRDLRIEPISDRIGVSINLNALNNSDHFARDCQAIGRTTDGAFQFSFGDGLHQIDSGATEKFSAGLLSTSAGNAAYIFLVQCANADSNQLRGNITFKPPTNPTTTSPPPTTSSPTSQSSPGTVERLPLSLSQFCIEHSRLGPNERQIIEPKPLRQPNAAWKWRCGDGSKLTEADIRQACVEQNRQFSPVRLYLADPDHAYQWVCTRAA